jgi:outer membrane lipoprotein-sorting protein
MPGIDLRATGAICYLMAALLSSLSYAGEPKQDTLTAQELLEHMAKTYADCKTYRDSGIVRTLFVQADRDHTIEKPFSTAFVRPDRFRFEYKEKKKNDQSNRYIIWRKGEDVQSWWDIAPNLRRPLSLGRALNYASGVSGGSSRTVPALLIMDEVGRLQPIDFTNAKRIKDAMLDKVACFRIQGQSVGSPMTIWIDKKRFLIRRIDSQRKFDDFRTEQTTTYEPVINGEISAEMLKFDPPHVD